MKIKSFFFNPFLLLAAALLLTLSLYSERYVSFYAPMTTDAVNLYFALCLRFVFLGAVWAFFVNCDGLFVKRSYDASGWMLFWFGVLLVVFELCIQGVPILGHVNYKDFGVGFLHVVALVSLNAGFLLVLSSSGIARSTLKYIAVFFVLSVLIQNRFQLLLGVMYVFLFYIRYARITLKKVCLFVLSGICLLYVFGILGTLRMSSILEVDFKEAESYILSAGGATEAYMDMGLPVSFFWGYLYLTSPLSNLNHNVDLVSHIGHQSDVARVFVFDLMPQTFSKRISRLFGVQPVDITLIRDHLNVSTAFAHSYNASGVFGALFYSIGISIFCFVICFLLRKSTVEYVAFIVHICAMLPFLIFHNVFTMPIFIFVAFFIFVRAMLPDLIFRIRVPMK